MCKKVSWETETLMGTAPPASRWERYIPRAAIPHVGLFVALMLYTAGGGLRGSDHPQKKPQALRTPLRWALGIRQVFYRAYISHKELNHDLPGLYRLG
ncbi:unnamed protein product [Pieris macdunnoughi]|uniref:Uncharacterized protein n=1 Tax=Pieris macdunnoughi TaxID=345717 RepID=A0A821XF69_9NEOP|nr:unnamed protein product [Pieris macdunnoughi]